MKRGSIQSDILMFIIFTIGITLCESYLTANKSTQQKSECKFSSFDTYRTCCQMQQLHTFKLTCCDLFLYLGIAFRQPNCTAERIGFSNNLSHAYRSTNIPALKISNSKEFPLLVMDKCLCGEPPLPMGSACT